MECPQHKLIDSSLWDILCKEPKLYEIWNESIDDDGIDDLNVDHFKNSKDLLSYIQNSTLMYHNVENYCHGREHLKYTEIVDIYCFKLLDCYIYFRIVDYVPSNYPPAIRLFIDVDFEDGYDF